MGRDPLINEFEYELLTNQWKGPAGAAFNSCWEFCKENSLIFPSGTLTEKGEQAIKDFEKYYEIKA
jgi:hypothetical protein